MSKKLVFLLSFCVFLLAPQIVGASVVINEIMYDLEGSDEDKEWVEILNIGDTDINLKDWRFNDGSNHILNEPPKKGGQGTLKITAGEYVILVDDATAFIADHPEFSGTVIDTVMSLKNTSATLRLINAEDSEIESVTYNSSWGADGDGNSLQRKNASGNSNEPTNWGIGTPTPGTLNTFSTEQPPYAPEGASEDGEEEMPPYAPDAASGDAAIGNQSPIARAGDNIIGFISQEIEFDGINSSDPDKDELFYFWNMGDGKIIDKPSFIYKYSYPGTYLVTLTVSDGQDYASDTITIKVKPQQITINEFIPNPEGKDEENEWIEIYNDSDSIVDISDWQLDDIASGSKPFIFPENTLIAPKSYIVFSRQITNIALNNDKDSVRLLLPEGIVFQEINYENPKQGQSSALINEEFVWSVPSPGMANLTSSELIEGIKKFTFQQSIESKTTKEPLGDYSWYFQNPEQEIEGGFTIQEPTINDKDDKDDKDKFAAVSSFAKATEDKSDNQTTLNLILMIIAVILAGSIIGLSLTKLSKKFP